MILEKRELGNSLKYARALKELKFEHRKEANKLEFDDASFLKRHGKKVLERYHNLGGTSTAVKVAKKKVAKKVVKKATKKSAPKRKKAASKKKVAPKRKKATTKKGK